MAGLLKKLINYKEKIFSKRIAINNMEGGILKKINFGFYKDAENFKKANKTIEEILFYSLYHNHAYKINLNEKEFEYLIKNSDLGKKPGTGENTILIAAIFCNQKEKLNLKNELFNYIIKNSNLGAFDFGSKSKIDALNTAIEVNEEKLAIKIIKTMKNRGIIINDDYYGLVGEKNKSKIEELKNMIESVEGIENTLKKPSNKAANKI